MIQLTNKDRFAVFRLPGRQQVEMYLSEAVLSVPFEDAHLKEKGYVVFPFLAEENSFFIAADHHYINPEWSFISGEKGAILSMSQSDYLKMIEGGIDALSSDFPKVILSRQMLVEVKEKNVTKVFNKLVKKYPDAFVFLWHLPETGTWVGASPEPLLTSEGQCAFLSVALAGTRPIRQTSAEWGAKEVDEHQWVVHFIEDRLDTLRLPFSKGKIHTVNAGNVQHLRTDFRYNTSDPGQVIRALHPTPAVCGLPRDEALRLIGQLEPYQRRYYTGFSGPVGQQIHLYVTLRCMQWFDGQVCLYIGGGITRQSIPEYEWEETNWKAQTLKDVLQKV